MNSDELMEAFNAFEPSVELSWAAPPPPLPSGMPPGGRAWLRSIASLLKLCPGEWLRLGPHPHGGKFGGLTAVAKNSGCEAIERTEPGGNFLYLRYPEKPAS